MKVTMLRNPPASVGCDLMEGETGSVDKAMAEKLLDLGIATTEEAMKAVAKPADIKGDEPQGGMKPRPSKS